MAGPGLEAAAVLLTGGTGFVGRALLQRWRRGPGPRALRCLVRDPRRAEAAGIPPGSRIVGSLEDRDALARAVDGVDAVVHAAGAITGLRRDDYLRANATGTAALVEALETAAPHARLVHVSSLAAAGPSRTGEESALPPDRCRPCSHYGDSKLRGERAVVESTLENWIIVRPPAVYGPGDAATRLLFRQSLAPLAVVPLGPRPLSLIHVRDLAVVLERALVCPWSRRIVPVEGPDRRTTHELVGAIAAACGRRARLLPLPAPLARLAAAGADLLARLRGRPSLFSSDKMREIAAEGWVADGAVAREVLGFSPGIPLALGLREVAEADGFVRPADAPVI